MCHLLYSCQRALWSAVLVSFAALLLICGVAPSSAAPVVNLVSPARQVADENSSFAIEVAATGNGTLTYEWSANGRPVPGATSYRFEVAAASLSDRGYYYVKVSDSDGSTQSATAFILVRVPNTEVWFLGSSGAMAGSELSSPNGDVVAVATGYSHSCGLISDGSVVARGQNTYGQCNVPAITDAVGVAAGVMHSAALKSDGTVVVWGTNSFGQLNVPSGLSGVVQLAASSAGTSIFAVKRDGTVVAWGDSSVTQYASQLSNVALVAPGESHVLAILRDGSVVALGSAMYGATTIPPALTSARAVSASSHSIAVAPDGTVYAWGSGAAATVPSDVGLCTKVVAGIYFSAALRVDGSVTAWGTVSAPTSQPRYLDIAGGAHFFAAMVDGGSMSAPTITQPPSDTTVVEGSTATLTVGVSGRGTIRYQWRKEGQPISGANASTYTITNASQLSAGSYEVVVSNEFGNRLSASAWVSVPAIPVISITSPTRSFVNLGDQASIQASATGTGQLSYQWIHNGFPIPNSDSATYSLPVVTREHLGWYALRVTDDNGSATSQPVFIIPNWNPTQLVQWGSAPPGQSLPSTITTSAGIAAGSSHGVGLKRDGTVYRWGNGYYGLDVVPANVTDGVAVSAGSLVAFVIRSNGTVTAWGGSGYAEDRVPAGLNNVAEIVGGYGFAIALRTNGEVQNWGGSKFTIPATLDVARIAAGDRHCLLLKTNGTVVGYGNNAHGQTTIPSGLQDVIAVACGTDFSVALRSDGTVSAWGKNDLGQTTVPAGLADVVAIAAGGTHALALKSNGTVISWGQGSENLTPPSDLRDVVGVAAGNNFSVALRDARSDMLRITAQPQSVVSSESQPASFSVSVAGAGQITYQWRKDGSPITGQTNRDLNLTNLSLSDAGQYDVVITNYIGSVVSDSATLEVNSSPVVTQLTARRQVVSAGGKANFAVSAMGTGPLKYEWRRNGRIVVGATSSVFQPTVRDARDAGWYIAYVTDDNGTRRSEPFFLMPQGTLVQSQVIEWGKPSTAWSGYVPYAVVRRDLVSISASGHSLVLTSNGDFYSWGLSYSGAHVSSTSPSTGAVAVEAGSETSAIICADGTVKTWGTVSYTPIITPGGLSDVVQIDTAYLQYHALKADGTIVSWGPNSFQPPSDLTGVVAISANSAQVFALKADGSVVAYDGQGYVTTAVPVGLVGVVAIAAGATNTLALKSDGTVVAWGVDFTKINEVPSDLANVVGITIGGDSARALLRNGTVRGWGRDNNGLNNLPSGLRRVTQISAGVLLTDALVADVFISKDPTSVIASPGRTVEFSVSAEGEKALTFQWRKNGVALSGATAATLAVIAPSGRGGDRYDVVVSDGTSSTFSEIAVLDVQGTTTSDFNADAVSDIIWQNANGGEFGLWLMDGTVNTGWVALGTCGPNWVIRGTGDFNADGRSDVIWQNVNGGEFGVWLMDGTINTGWVSLGSCGPNWVIRGSGDFNADGHSDLIWQNINGGEFGLWLMNGTSNTGWVPLGTCGPNWVIRGAGDFNGDGYPDLIWQNINGGEFGLWLMQATTNMGWVSLGTCGPNWIIRGCGDFNLDSGADLIWQNTNGGEFGVWLMNGTLNDGWNSLGSAGPNWIIRN